MATRSCWPAPSAAWQAARCRPDAAPSTRLSVQSPSHLRPAAAPTRSAGDTRRSPRQDGVQQARRAPWPARAITQTRQRAARLLTRFPPAMPPPVRRRRRHVEGGRGRLQRHPFLDRAHQRETASQSELGVSVQNHPSPPSSVSRGRPTASKEGRTATSAVHNLCRRDSYTVISMAGFAVESSSSTRASLTSPKCS
jgi:hypothetical protein